MAKEVLGITCTRAPAQVTIHRILRKLKVEAFERVLGQWFQARGLWPGDGIALDGKTLRGIHGEEVPGVHLVSAYAHRKGIVLDRQAAPDKGHELEAVREIPKRLEVARQVVTGDALLAQKDICRGLGQKGGTISPD